ncbi:MAG: DUF4274 domain-containing protein [Verrucomicrobiota bacterium]
MFNESQKLRLQKLAEYKWYNPGDDDATILAKLSRLMSEIETPEELVYSAIVKIWSFEDESIWFILDHPICDYGIALRIYWMCQPDFFYRLIEKGEELEEDEKQKWEMIKQIEARLLSGYYKQKNVAFDPSDAVGRAISDADPYRPGLRLIPQELKAESFGEVIVFNLENIWSK